MKARAAVYVLVAIAIVVFAVANRALLVQPVELNLLVSHVQAPLAILLLLLAAVILLLDFAVHALSEHAWIRERRSLVRDLETARQRAESEEQSRMATLRSVVERECAAIRGQLDRVLAGQSALLGRTSATEPPRVVQSSGAIEPELIPPRDSTARGAH